MKFFLDTANIDEIREGAKTGLIDGITTNPSLVAKEGKDFKTLVKEIASMGFSSVSAEVISTDFEGMLKEGQDLAKVADNVAVKVPLTVAGLRTCHALSSDGVDVNVTLCFSPNQALLAAKAGAKFISPFIGRLDDIGEDGMSLIAEIIEVYSNYDFNTQVLAASIRHPQHVLEAAKLGADIGTMPYSVFNKLYQHPLTDSGLEKFLADWKKVSKSFFQ